MTVCDPTRVPRLALVERRALLLVAQGLTDRQIADQMWIAVSTALAHIKHARERLGVRTREQAVACALLYDERFREELLAATESGLIDPAEHEC